MTQRPLGVVDRHFAYNLCNLGYVPEAWTWFAAPRYSGIQIALYGMRHDFEHHGMRAISASCFVCLFVWLLVCLSVCPSVLSVCQSVCLCAVLVVCSFVCLVVRLLPCLLVCLSFCLCAYLYVSPLACLLACF